MPDAPKENSMRTAFQHATWPSTGSSVDRQWYRRVLGQFPTGVCVITADSPTSGPSGMVVGTFTSVSLDPTLIAFLPAKSSTSWRKIEATGSFCVNMLGADQESLCRTFSSSAGDTFDSLSYRAAGTGSPILDNVVAWIDCDIETVQEAGDHLLVIGRVRALELEQPCLPLLFFEGGYGRFSHLSLAAPNPGGLLTEPLRNVDLVRPLMESLAEDFQCRCIATTGVDDEVVVVASAGQSQSSDSGTTLVRQRMPFVPPMSSVFAAWDDVATTEHWLKSAPSEKLRARHRLALDSVKSRGVSLGLLTQAQRTFATTFDDLAAAKQRARNASLYGLIQQLSYDPLYLTDETPESIRQISAPIFAADGSVALAFTLYGFSKPVDGIDPLIAGLLDLAAAATRRIGGRPPGPGSPEPVA